jgi:hypothetical protein
MAATLGEVADILRQPRGCLWTAGVGYVGVPLTYAGLAGLGSIKPAAVWEVRE